MESKQFPRGFRFSQTNLDIFGQCRRRFFLRYVRRMDWPAAVTVAAEHWEEALERGQLFHQIVQQHALGIEVEEMVRQSEDALLRQWWRNYVEQPPTGIPAGEILSEISLVVAVGQYRLLAKFDRLVFARDGQIFICDWKTGRQQPVAEKYEHHWQTLVYHYVLVEGAGALTEARQIAPEEVTLVYWHAGFPEHNLTISYSPEQHRAAREQIEEVVATISALEGEDDFPKTEQLELCQRCEYRSYCERGREAVADWDIDEEDLDWDLIPEAEL